MDYLGGDCACRFDLKLSVREMATREVGKGSAVIKVVPMDEKSPGQSPGTNGNMRMINVNRKVDISAHCATEVDLDEIGFSHNRDPRGHSGLPPLFHVAMSAL
jgi:hypothetical protein